MIFKLYNYSKFTAPEIKTQLLKELVELDDEGFHWLAQHLDSHFSVPGQPYSADISLPVLNDVLTAHWSQRLASYLYR